MNNKKNNLKVHFVSDSPLSKLTFGKWKQNGNSLKPDSSLHGTKEDRGFLQNAMLFAQLPKCIAIYQNCSWWKSKMQHKQTANTHNHRKEATLALCQGTGGIYKS